MKSLSSVLRVNKLVFILLAAAGLFMLPGRAEAGKVKSRKVMINTEAGAIIFIDGKQAETNPIEIRVEANTNVIVRVEKPGYISQEKNYQNDGNHEIPREEFFKLEVDDAVQNSTASDRVNNDVNIKTNLREDDAWKMISHIVTSSFDAIDVSDKSAGYLRTGWVVNTFKSSTIRTRVIIKIGSSTPLVYRAKVVSEIAKTGTPVSQDESFKPWNRVLRSYENIINDLEGRLIK